MQKMQDEITLWAGDIGTRLDAYGNIYTVRKDASPDKYTPPDLLKLYQDAFRQMGLTVLVEEFPIDTSMYAIPMMRVIHRIEGIPTSIPFHFRFGYDYPR